MHRTENLLVRAILLFVLPAACASHHAGSPVRDVAKCTEYPLVQVGQGGGVIFPAGTGNVDGYRAGAITEFWTPTADDVQRAEPRITEYLQANAPALVPKFSSYVRQYTGFRLGGRTLIFVQFFCVAPTNVDWRCAPVVVDDGGECYFRLVYDVGGDSCGNLYVNGDA